MQTKKNAFLLFTILSLSMTSCSFSEKQEALENTENIIAVLENNCDCHTISKIENKYRKATKMVTYKLVGCEFDEFEKEASRVNHLLQDSIQNFCEIDEFKLIFVNRGEETTINSIPCK